MSPSRPASVLIKSFFASRIIHSCISRCLSFKAKSSLSFCSSSSAAWEKLNDQYHVDTLP